MKILVIDDQRIFDFGLKGRTDTVIHCTTTQAGLQYLYNLQPWDQVWLDHDMGEDSEGSGTDLVNKIESDDKLEIEPKPNVGRFFVHSFNPVGTERMLRVLAALGYSVQRIDASEYLDYDEMKKQGRNPMLRGPRR